MSTDNVKIRELSRRAYKYGFVSDLLSDALPRGLDEQG